MDSTSGAAFITFMGRSRPCCLIPTLTVGSENEALSMIPLLEFPTSMSTCRNKLQYVRGSRFVNSCPTPRASRNDFVLLISERLPASAVGITKYQLVWKRLEGREQCVRLLKGIFSNGYGMIGDEHSRLIEIQLEAAFSLLSVQ